MEEGVCKLCGVTGKLHMSHILPEFLYGSTYDEKHRFILVPDSTDTRMALKQKGLRESLLCSSCETLISRWATYASHVLFQTDTFQVTDETYGFVVHGVDYIQMKLFQMSILWRMGVSNLDMFKQVQLGTHEERLRLSLLESNPGGYHFYPCLFLHVSQAPIWLKRAITAPTLFKYEGQNAYRFFAAALIQEGSRRHRSHFSSFPKRDSAGSKRH